MHRYNRKNFDGNGRHSLKICIKITKSRNPEVQPVHLIAVKSMSLFFWVK